LHFVLPRIGEIKFISMQRDVFSRPVSNIGSYREEAYIV